MMMVVIAIIKLTDVLRGAHQSTGITLKEANVLSSVVLNYLLI
jgi:hypothetical protein